VRRVVVMLSQACACSLFVSAFANGIVVQPGDTLWSIARQHGTTIEELRTLNGLAGDLLPIGAVLDLPGGVQADDQQADVGSTAAPATPTTWTVRPGDTLYDIALANDVTVEDLMVWNRITGSMIRPGQEIVLGPTSTGADVIPLSVDVKPGDSLWRFARTYGLNPLTAPYLPLLARESHSVVLTETLAIPTLGLYEYDWQRDVSVARSRTELGDDIACVDAVLAYAPSKTEAATLASEFLHAPAAELEEWSDGSSRTVWWVFAQTPCTTAPE